MLRSIFLLPLLFLAIVFPTVSNAQIDNGVKLLKGVVSDAKTGKPVDGGKVWVYQQLGSEPVTNSKINPTTGRYQVLLNPSTTYRFEFSSPRYFLTSTNVVTPDIREDTVYEEVDRHFTIEPIPIGENILSARLFEPGSATLTVTPTLEKVIDLLAKERAIVITVIVTPDALAPVEKPEAKKATASSSKKTKRSKKTTQTEAVAETLQPTAIPEFSEEQFVALAQDRSLAIKNFMKERKISVTRLHWGTKPGVLLRSGTDYSDNVVIAIKDIEVEEE